MKRLIVYLAIILTWQANCNGQSFFNLTDSVFKAGQISRFEIIYQLSGGDHPVIESRPILDSIVDFLKKNKNLKIEVGSYTDYRDDSTVNYRLSEWRAKSATDYFIEKGIDIDRLEYKGYGECKPIIVDSIINEKYPFLAIGQKLNEDYITKLDTREKQELANRLNRRTEIKIVEIKKRP